MGFVIRCPNCNFSIPRGSGGVCKDPECVKALKGKPKRLTAYGPM